MKTPSVLTYLSQEAKRLEEEAAARKREEAARRKEEERKRKEEEKEKKQKLEEERKREDAEQRRLVQYFQVTGLVHRILSFTRNVHFSFLYVIGRSF